MITQTIRKIRRLHYSCINTIVPFKKMRWMLTASIVMTYIAATSDFCQDLNTYLVGFYLLMLLLSYFLPKGVSHDIESFGMQQENPFLFSSSLGGSSSFQQVEEQFGVQHEGDKPLLRQLSEIQLWQRSTLAISAGLICSYFKMLQIDVFWPLLLVYFIGLAVYTLLKIVRTMNKYGYGLSDFQKQLK